VDSRLKQKQSCPHFHSLLLEPQTGAFRFIAKTNRVNDDFFYIVGGYMLPELFEYRRKGAQRRGLLLVF
jgi:hypothetical protein